MTDWDAVERLRTKGWDWDRIASDPKVEFHADDAAGNPGRALRALYYQRRSRGQRRPARGSKAERDAEGSDPLRPRWNLARLGFLLVPLLAVWLVLAYLYPSPVGVYITWFPTLVFLLVIGVGVLCFGLLRAVDKWTTTYRNAAVMGALAGLVIAGGFGLAAVAAGCPSLTSTTSQEPSNWEKASNPAWTSGGNPVFFFYGSIACPYCSASSWSMKLALERFGVLTGLSYGYSSPTDQAGPNTPEVILASAALQSQYITLDVAEATDPTTITLPSISSCIEQAYVSSYGSGGIPFNVVGGVYIHTGTMVQPSALHGLTYQAVEQQISNQSGPAWDAVSGPAYALEAFMVKANGGNPASVANDPNVATVLTQIK